ncbi:MAG: MOSC domain-containing protein [Chloroflexota bacterium]|nr:MOSC domain-containing protein [Chloroflexota bacterium]
MGTIIAVCTSNKKGTRKTPISHGTIQKEYGLVGDAHADCHTHRQVSLLAIESIDKMRALGFELCPGDFAENLTTEGIELLSVSPGDQLAIGDEIILEVTQIGKECHSGCDILEQTGRCIMPEEGIFAKVIRGGIVRVGDTIIKKDTPQHDMLPDT